MTFWTAARKRAVITFIEGFLAVFSVEAFAELQGVSKYVMVGIVAGLLSVARALKAGLPEAQNVAQSNDNGI